MFNKNKKIFIIVLVFILVLIFLLLIIKDKNITSKEKNIPKMCEGVNIIFFAGGNENDSFASVVAKGAQDAQNELGANVEYVWSSWDAKKMVDQFKDSIFKMPDAIAIMGHPGSKLLGSLVEEAITKGIIVTSQNVDIPDIRSKYSNEGFGYVGQKLYESGILVSSGVVKKYGFKEGEEAIVFGVDPKIDINRYERTRGAVDGLKGKGLIVHEITVSPEVQKDATSPIALEMIKDTMEKYPNSKLIIADKGVLTNAMPSHLKNLGKKPGEIIVAGFDLSVNTVDGIKSGYISLILDQQPYLQGYLPILQSCLSKKYGFSGLYIDTGIGLVDETNVDDVSFFVEQKIR